jgi:hypothetical protein
MRRPSLNSSALLSGTLRNLIYIYLALLSAFATFAQVHRLPPILFFVFASHLGMAKGSSKWAVGAIRRGTFSTRFRNVLRTRECRWYSALSIIAPSVNVLRRTRRKPSTIRGAAPEVVIGQSTAARAGARPLSIRNVL